MMKMMQNLTIIFVLTFGFQVHAEYILYRVGAQDPSMKATIDYDRLSPEEQLAISELYKKTIERYQWPTVMKYFSTFAPEERDRYLQALGRKNGLSDFIAHAVVTQSQGKFGALWISTTVFEMVAILLSLQILDAPLINTLYWNNGRYLAGAQTIVFAESQMCKIFDFILREFVNLNQAPLNFIQNVGEVINAYGNPNELLVDPTGQSSCLYSYEYYPMYNQEWLPIIKNYLLQEQQAMESNCFILSRGTNGYRSDHGFVVDYETGGAEGLSYGYSLLAGTFFERYYGQVAFRAIKGARSID